MGDYAYGYRYKQIRASLLGLPCELRLLCGGDPADSADHSPPLSRHEHREKSGCCVLRPACMRCQSEQAKVLSMLSKREKRDGVVPEVAGDPVQSMEWL